MKHPAPTVTCPTCGQPARWHADNPWRPFCCERCKLIDLGEWLAENHRIPGPPELDSLDRDLEAEEPGGQG